MAQPILVTQSTSIVQVDTSQVIFGSPAVVLLSSLNAPGTLVTIRDIAGLASTNRGVVVSTTVGVHFLDGPSCNIYTINQPYGFLTVTPKTSSIWAVTNTFAFPEGSTAANVNQFTANFATISSLSANRAQLSTVGISTLSTDMTQVRYNLSVGQSTIADTGYVKGAFTALSSISTAGTVYAASSLVTRDILASGHLQVSCIQVQQSTGYALQVAGAAEFASTVSVLRDVYVGGNISTQGNVIVGGSLSMNGGLQLSGTINAGNLSTTGFLGVGRDAQFQSSLQVRDNATFYRHVSIASNLLVAGGISTLNTLAASSVTITGQAFVGTNLSVMSSIYAGGNVSVAGNLAVAGNLIFNDVLLDLNALSIFSTLTVGGMISTMGNIAVGSGLRVMGSTILQGLVSTASSMNVGGSISTTGNLAVGGSATFFSSLSVRGAVTKLGDVNIGGLLSTQSTLVVGDSIRVASNMFIGGVISSLSSINAAGTLTMGGQAYLSSGMSTIGAAVFFSSMQIQGSLSVMSSIVVRQDMTVQGTLNAAGFSLPGAAAVASLGVQISTGVSAVFAGSTVQTGLLSTLGGINMGGQFSTPNTITTGSTLNARFVVTTSNISTQGSLGVGGDMSLSGRGTFCNLTVTSNLQTTAASSNVFAGCNIFSNVPYFNQGFNGDLTQNYAMGNVTVAGSLGVSQGATFSNQVTAQSNLNTSSLTVTGNTLMSNFTSTLGQAAFFSSVAIQGTVSVFSSMNVSCNLTVGGTLTAGSFQLPGGAILQTLAVTSTSGFTVNISSSTLHAGLFSTSGAIFSGREISTTSSILVGGIGYFQTGLSTLGQAAFSSNVQVNGGLISLSTIIAPAVSANKIQASSIGIGVAESSNAVDIAGTVAIQGTSRSNTLRLTATDLAPGITLSNATANYTLFNTKSADVPGAGAFAILDNSEAYRMVMFPNGNTAIGKASGAAPLDVNGLALADSMGAPLAQFSTVGAATVNASTLNVLSNITITGNTGGGTALEINTTSGSGRGIVVNSVNNASISLSNILEGAGMTAATVRFGGEVSLNSSGGDSIIRTESASNKLLLTTGFTNATLALSNGSVGIGTVNPTTTLDVVGTVNARTALMAPRGTISTLGVSSLTASTITSGARRRLNLLSGSGTNSLAYASDYSLSFTYVTGIINGGGRGFATNGNIILLYGNDGGGTSPIGYSFDGINWTRGNSIGWSSVSGILWDGRQFIAVGTGTYAIQTSPDGINWTEQTSSPSVVGGGFKIAFNGSLYVMGFSHGAIYTTPDLITWTQRISPFTTNVRAVAWTGSRWIAGGVGTNSYASSPDGITWTGIASLNALFTGNTVREIAVNGSTVVVGGWTSAVVGVIAYSLDGGQTWAQADLTTNSVSFSGIEAVWWNGSYYLAGGSGTTTLATSPNGILWTPVATSFTSSAHAGIGIGFTTRIQDTNFGQLAADSISTTGSLTVGDTFRVGISTLSVNPLLQNMGINCNAPRFTLDVNGNINAGGNLYVAGTVFQGGGGSTGPTLSTNRIFASTITTSSINVTNTLLASNAANTFTFVSGTNSGQTAGLLWRTSDGTNYTQISLTGTPVRVDAVAFNGNTYVAIGNNASTALAWQSTDGITWSQIAWTTTISQAYAIAWNGQYWLVGGLENTNTNRQIVRTSDFATFTNASSGLLQGYISGLAWNGTVWVAVGKDNSFLTGTTQNIRYSYDGLTWSSAVNGFNASANSIGVRVLWSGTQFVAVGADTISPIKYSYDGIVWYNSANALSVFSYLTTNCYSVAYNGKMYVATGTFSNSVADANRLGRIGYSYDGITWYNALSNNTFTNRGFGVGWTGTQWIVGGQDSTAANTSIRTSIDGIYWTPSVTTSVGTSVQPLTVSVNSNVVPDAQIGNTSFYSKQQLTFLTSTNTVQQFSNAMLINDLYTDTEGHVGINCNAPGGYALAVNGFVSMNNQAPINVAVVGTTDSTAANQLKYSLDYGQTWNSATLNPAPGTTFGTGAIAWNGSYFLGFVATSATSGSFYSSSNGVVWNSNPMVGESNMFNVRGLVWAPPYWVAVGTSQLGNNSNTSIIRSLDGVTWSRAISGGFASTLGAGFATGSGQSIAFNGRRLVATGQDITNSQIKYSDDLGATWLTAYGYSQQPFNVVRTVATNGRVWVASALVGGPGVFMYSTDGANWVPTNFRFPGGLNVGISWNGTLFVASGAGGTVVSGSNGNTDRTLAYSYDGINWSWGSNTFIYGATSINNVWTGRNFLAFGNWGPALGVSTPGATGFWRVKTSVDGITWTNVTSTQNPTWNGVYIGAAAYSSNVYADLQVENLAIYGRNQFPLTQSTNNINVSNSNITINNGLTIASNGFMGYATTNPRAAFDVLGGGGADNLFVQTIAGSLTGVSGMLDGYTTSARLSRPIGVATDSNQNCYFADFNNHRIRVVFSNGVVSTLAGSGTGSSVDGVGSLATFSGPHGICIDPANANLYVTDYLSRVIRRVAIATGTVTTIAGTSGAAAALTDGIGAAARFNQPIGCIVRPDNSELYIADTGNHAIRKITLANSNVVTFAGSNTSGRNDAVGTAARFNVPVGLAITATTLYISDNQNNMIRSAALSTSNVSTIAGSPTGGETSGGTPNITQGFGSLASVWAPQGIALNPASNLLYIMNTGRFNGTMSALDFNNSNYVSIYINGGQASSINVIDGSIGTAKFNAARMLATDPVGNIYISEDIGCNTANRIRKLTSNYTSSIAALSFDYSGGGLSHYIRSRHMPTNGRAAENAIDFFLNTSFNTLSSISTGSGNVLAASITAAGVGIGTATPCNMLHIAQDLPYSFRAYNPLPAQLMITGQATSATMKLGTYYTGSQGVAGTIQVADSYWGKDVGAPLLLNPLDGFGYVGIGTSNPLQQLHLNGGGLYITGNATNYGDTTSASFWNQSGVGPTIAGANITFRTNGTTERMRITSAGDVIMCNGSAGYGVLKLYGSGNETTIHIQDPPNSSPAGYTGWFVGQTNSWGAANTTFGIARLNNGGVQSGIGLWMMSNGRVGVGTATPEYTLSVNGSMGFPNAIALYAKNAAGANEIVMHPRWSDNIMYINIGSAGLNVRANDGVFSRMYIDSIGRVGIGTTNPRSALEVNGKIYIMDNGTAANPSLSWPDPADTDSGFYHPGDAQIGVTINGTEKVRFNTTGVGIGTTNPEQALHVAGNILMTNQTVIMGKNSSGTVESCLYPRWSDNVTYFDYGTGGLHIRTNIGAATTMFMTNNRRIGIQRTDPQYVFHIANAAWFSATGSGDQFLVFANASGSGSYFYYNSANGYGTASDKRLKENISSISSVDALNFIVSLEPSEYNLKGVSTSRQAGFIAQDILSNAKTVSQKSIVNNWETYDESNPNAPTLGVSDRGIVAYLVGAVKQLKAEFDAYKAEHP